MGRPKGSKNKKATESKDPETVNEKAVAVIDQNASEPEVIEKQDQEQPAESERESMLAPISGVTPEELKKALDVQTQNRKVIKEFIEENLRDGTDFGKIHVVKNCYMEEKQRGSCDKDYHYSKSILLKPGQEKIFSLFGITDELEKDLEAYEMLPDVKGLIAYKCTLYRGPKKVGEGRGASTLQGERSDPNSAIKKAQKRARMDACLSLGFSEYFTQDLDDPEYASQREMANSRAAAEAERKDKDEFGLMPRDPDDLIDNNERAVLHKMLLKAGFSEQEEILELLKSNGISDPKAMTSGEARGMMKKLKNATFAGKVDDNDQDPDGGLVVPPKPPEPMQPAELEVDDDLKQHIQENFLALNLNARGEMWFRKQVAGRPFGNFDKFEDKDWRRAYQFIEDIQEGRVEVDESHYNKKPGSQIPDNVDPETGEIMDIDPRDDRDEDREIAQTAQTIFNDEEESQDDPEN